MARRAEPNSSPVQPVETLPDPVPDALAGLPEVWHRYFRSAAHEISTVRQRMTSTDRQMLIAATLALHGESNARKLAAKAMEIGAADEYIALVRLAQSESRAARATLASLGLTGSHRALSEKRRKEAHATDPEQGAASASEARWGNLLDR
ncbi:MAG TPA: hypothetical protein VNQ78_09860 [Paracoccus sp. (in: a-proteobacteria)]|uniref:hypothetical protein n=1 Tax=Paracoccus sp. TaxID=267 RepID=UPI002C5FA3BD|nr:hypothetical protein [Paracoccus sp. (in: a-proteobacteria)]HWL56963.1 hypothetical protein [Paracoccus sp. (in: a-proteobacteria)]